MIKRGHCFVAGLLGAAFLLGCGGGEKTETAVSPPPEIRVTLDGYMAPQNVGLLVADEQGYFDEEGLDVSLLGPAEPRRPVTYVAQRYDVFGVAQMPQVVLAKEKGAPILAVGSVLPRPTAAMMWLPKSGIRSIADLRGRTIATPGIPYQEEFLETVLEGSGLTLEDVRIRHVRFNLVQALFRERADAIFGAAPNLEGAALESLGAKPVITPISDLGIPAYDELVVLVRTDTLAEEPEMVRAFMSAVLRGTRFAASHPQAAAEAIENGPETNPRSSRREIEAELEATLPLLSKTGYMDPVQTTGLVEWMEAQGQIKRRIPAADLLTDEYLPQPEG